MDECRHCGSKALSLFKGAPGYDADYSCADCGEWQNAIVNSAWLIVGYKDDKDVHELLMSYEKRVEKGLKPHREACICELCLEWESKRKK